MRQLPPLSALIAFEAAARHISFQAAARELHLTPSAVSHQIKNLEGWLNRPLFVRATRRLLLTDDGRRLLADLTPALDAIAEGCAVLRPAAQRTHLAVHCAPSFAAKWLGPRLPHFMLTHPGAPIRLSSGPEPIDLQRQTQIDVLIAYGVAPDAPGILVEDLGLEITAPLCAPRLLEAGPDALRRRFEEVVCIESQLNPVRWADWCKLNGLRPSVRPSPSFDRGSLAVAAAVDGLGVALETLRFAEAELAQGELVALVEPGWTSVQRPLHFLCYRESEKNQPDLKTFVQWLKRELQPSAAGSDTR